MKIIQIISENKRLKLNRYRGTLGSYTIPPLQKGHKRVEAIIEINEQRVTRHIDIRKQFREFHSAPNDKRVGMDRKSHHHIRLGAERKVLYKGDKYENT